MRALARVAPRACAAPQAAPPCDDGGLRRLPKPAPEHANLFSRRLLEAYPYKLARRAKARPARQPGVARPPKLPPSAPPQQLPTREEAEAAAAATPDGVEGLLSLARGHNAQGAHAQAYAAALLAQAASDAPAARADALAAQHGAQAGLLVDCWASAVAVAAAREEARAARAAARAAAAASRKRASAVRKERQGYTKPLMRLLHVRLCCACRALAPRELMWRVMQLRPHPKPAAARKPLPRRRRVKRRWVTVRRRGAPEAAAAAAAAEAIEAAAEAAEPAEAEEEEDAAEEEGGAPLRRAGDAAAAPGAAQPAPHPKGPIMLQRLPGGALAALQADDAVWSPPRRSVRSTYICRRLACVQLAIKRKQLGRSLGATPPPRVCDALLAAAEADEAAAAAAPPGAPRAGVSAERAAEVAELVPRIAPRPASQLRGPHDRWDAPPEPPR